MAKKSLKYALAAIIITMAIAIWAMWAQISGLQEEVESLRIEIQQQLVQ